jgi:hypothetical protein
LGLTELRRAVRMPRNKVEPQLESEVQLFI